MIEHFRNAMQQSGLSYSGEIIADGTLHRFKPENDKNGTNAWYILYNDEHPAGAYGDWKRDISKTWSFKSRDAMSPDEISAHFDRITQTKNYQQQQLKIRHEVASKAAQEIWSKATHLGVEDHPYLQLKKVKSYGLKILKETIEYQVYPKDYNKDGSEKIHKIYAGTLLVPMYDESFGLVNVERIYFSTEENKFKKRALSGGKRSGCFYYMGDWVESIIICEGYSTGATLRENVSNSNIVISFDCGNLPHVAQVIRNKFPRSKIIIAADKDKKGAGEKYARKAADLVGGTVILPKFDNFEHAMNPSKNYTDFNDLYCLVLETGLDRLHASDEVYYHFYNNEKTIITKDSYPECVPDRNGKLRPLNTYGNLDYLIKNLGIVTQWNCMSHVREVVLPNSKTKLFLDDSDNSALRLITNEAELNFFHTSKIDDHLTTLAQKNAYHPIVKCITSKSWDKKQRLDTFISKVKTTNDEFSHELIKRWMLSAIAAAFSEKGFSAQGVLVLQGKQDIGKTRWVKSLDPINCGAVKEGALLDPSNKDSVIACAAHWIVELGELDATFRRADIARLKSHITNQVDIVRFPYARKNSILPRRTVFVATVNESNYLIDDTGNRRWWTIEVISIDLNHGLDMQQIWAEAYHLWKEGNEITWLSKDEIQKLNEVNSSHEQTDPLEEKLLEVFDWHQGWEKGPTLNFSSSQVLEKLGYNRPTRSEVIRLGNIIIKLTGIKPKKTNSLRVHRLPLLNSKFLVN